MSVLDDGQLRSELGWDELLEEDHLAILQGREGGESGIQCHGPEERGINGPNGKGGSGVKHSEMGLAWDLSDEKGRERESKHLARRLGKWWER